MHIPDWDEKFLSEFDADRYVEALVQSRAQSIVCYAQSHVGLFNYPTKVGRQHGGLKGRDIVAEMIERCHQHDIAVVLYVSVIHDRWASDEHPEWRIVHPNGGHFGARQPARVRLPELALPRVRPRLDARDLRALRLRGHALRHDVLALRLLLRPLPGSAGPMRSAARCRARSTGPTNAGSPSSACARRGWGISRRCAPTP